MGEKQRRGEGGGAGGKAVMTSGEGRGPGAEDGGGRSRLFFLFDFFIFPAHTGKSFFAYCSRGVNPHEKQFSPRGKSLLY